ncbi:carboxyltransferase domain-containing protein [Streptomyces sp. NPDC005899]|uniref:carboxyltransferase domain-containing protein n=1 Tax=Streptomyces sp. NPDC005899 TaxID=3155716 RepID=UPI0033E07A96
MSGFRVLPAGPGALLAEFATGEEAEAFHAELLRRRADGALADVRDVVPGARTVLLDGIGGTEGRPGAGRGRAALLARELASWDVPPLVRGAGEAVEIRVVYDGPDLADVGRAWGVGAGEVAGIHAGTEFRVAFCGFAPGFGYLTGLPGHLRVPRRSTPRTRVPAGALALAGPYTGVYPRPSPGGWQLIGSGRRSSRWTPAHDQHEYPGTRSHQPC